MASAESPRKRRRNGRRLALIIGGVVLLVALVGGTFAAFARQAPVAGTLPEGWQTVSVEAGTISSTVSATGNVEPASQAELRFAASGTVTEVLVGPGDEVRAGQPLARIDASALQLKLEQAEADLAQAQADYDGLLDGATEAEVAEAQARIAQARSQYQQTASSVSQADIAAARADLESARAALAELERGAANDELASANEKVTTAQSTLDQARVDLSAAKEKARLDVDAKANALRTAQEAYSRYYWENKQLESAPGDLPQSRIDEEGRLLRAVQDAEAALAQSNVDYEKARQDEINKLQQYEAALTSAIAARDKVTAGPKADALAKARADVQRAQASLDELTGANRNSDLAAQAANIEIAQAGLAKLNEAPTESTLASRQAAVLRAEVALKQAQRDLADATLAAPFAATIARVDMQVGEPADTSAIIAVVDLSSFHVDVPVDELDIAQVTPGQRVTITLDALPAAEIGGAVTLIAPEATRSEQGTTTYEVTVTLDEGSAGVRPGMTAVVEIITAEKTDALLVPRRAVRSEGGASYVLVPTGGAPTPGDAPGQLVPASERREITLGLSNSEYVEVLSGLAAGDEVLVQDVVSTFLPGGPPN